MARNLFFSLSFYFFLSRNLCPSSVPLKTLHHRACYGFPFLRNEHLFRHLWNFLHSATLRQHPKVRWEKEKCEQGFNCWQEKKSKMSKKPVIAFLDTSWLVLQCPLVNNDLMILVLLPISVPLPVG